MCLENFARIKCTYHTTFIFKAKSTKILFSHNGARFSLGAGASLKNKTENNSTWEGAFYQSERVKINSN